MHQIELEMQNETLRQTMVALEESRKRYAERYAELYEFAPVGYLTVSESGQIAEANLTASRLLGVERSQLHNKRFDHFVATADLDRWQQLFRRLQEGAGWQTLDVVLRHGDTSEILVHLDCRRDQSNEMPRCLRIAITDISERKQIEQQLRENEAVFRSIFDNNLDAVLLTGPNGSILAANLEAQRLFGYSGEALQTLGQQGVIDATDPRFAAALAKRDQDGWFRGEVTMVGKGGNKFPAELFSSVFTDKHGQRMTTMLVRDITERQRKADLLREAKEEAEKANNAKSRFLAAASHDLRQPLAALRLYTDVLKNKAAASVQDLVAGMDDCIANLSGLLTDLLDLSKLEAGVVKPNIADFSVFELLASLESVHMLEAQGKGLRLQIQPSRLMGRSDPLLIKRIIGNLLQNAIRYTDRGGVVIGCRRRQGKTWIEVWDSGIGIAADQTTAIFEEFRQLGDEARNRGSGLGLAIVAKTAALLGLQFSVRSWPGRGSVFAIELPLGQLAAMPSPERPVAVKRSLRIALVEDNSFVLEAMVLALQTLGHQVIAATSGGALLTELGTLPADIVVSDYRLTQGETGFDAITAVRKAHGDDLPAIIITGDTDPKLMATMTKNDVVVLHKPVDMEELKVQLEKLTTPASSPDAFGAGHPTDAKLYGRGGMRPR
ncbi:MAG TPA: PAS domain S-box protein [Azonexus sp.]|nr:PAS domain S-box protein [Azonexus sp.]